MDKSPSTMPEAHERHLGGVVPRRARDFRTPGDSRRGGTRSRWASSQSSTPRQHGDDRRYRDAPPLRLDGGGHDPQWLKSDGDAVERGEELVEIETDKANMTYEADSDGVLSIVAQEGGHARDRHDDRAATRRARAAPTPAAAPGTAVEAPPAEAREAEVVEHEPEPTPQTTAAESPVLCRPDRRARPRPARRPTGDTTQTAGSRRPPWPGA
jgi:hypothetical protein